MISIIPKDGNIVVDGVGVTIANTRVAPMFESNVHAVQFFPDRNVGHIEYDRDIYDSNPMDNKMITSEDIDVASILSLHSTALTEQEGDRHGI